MLLSLLAYWPTSPLTKLYEYWMCKPQTWHEQFSEIQWNMYALLIRWSQKNKRTRTPYHRVDCPNVCWWLVSRWHKLVPKSMKETFESRCTNTELTYTTESQLIIFNIHYFLSVFSFLIFKRDDERYFFGENVCMRAHVNNSKHGAYKYSWKQHFFKSNILQPN